MSVTNTLRGRSLSGNIHNHDFANRIFLKQGSQSCMALEVVELEGESSRSNRTVRRGLHSEVGHMELMVPDLTGSAGSAGDAAGSAASSESTSENSSRSSVKSASLSVSAASRHFCENQSQNSL